MGNDFLSHADRIVEHVEARFAGLAAAAKGHDQDVGVIEFFIAAGADLGIVAAQGAADAVVQVHRLSLGLFLQNINQDDVVGFAGLNQGQCDVRAYVAGSDDDHLACVYHKTYPPSGMRM